LVFLDEPTSALDPIGRRLVRDIIRKLKAENKTVFLNSHLLSEVEAVCDRVAIIQRGEVVRDGTLDELLSAHRLLDVHCENLSEELLANLKARWSLAAHEGDRLTLALTDPSDVPHVVAMLVNGGVAVHHVVLRHETLEDLFVRTVDDTGA
jgi:ABC-2 type transport system ATP-binding protein